MFVSAQCSECQSVEKFKETRVNGCIIYDTLKVTSSQCQSNGNLKQACLNVGRNHDSLKVASALTDSWRIAKKEGATYRDWPTAIWKRWKAGRNRRAGTGRLLRPLRQTNTNTLRTAEPDSREARRRLWHWHKKTEDRMQVHASGGVLGNAGQAGTKDILWNPLSVSRVLECAQNCFSFIVMMMSLHLGSGPLSLTCCVCLMAMV